MSKSSSVSGQYRIILSADTASEVPQLPERCLSRKAGIVRCCLSKRSRILCLRKIRFFVALICTSGAGADRDRQGGTGNQGQGRGDKKANGISAANPHPVVKGERRPVGGRAIHQTHTRRRKHRKPFAGARCTHRAAKKREPCAANLPSLPQGAHPAARPRHKQAHAKQIIAQKQGNVAKKANFAAKLRSVCAENHKHAVKVYKRDRCQKENQE